MSPIQPLRESSLAAALLDEVKSEIALRGISGIQLSRMMGVSNGYLAKRLRGEAPLSIPDIDKIAELLEIDVLKLTSRAVSNYRERAAAYAPQRVTPTRPTASATTPRVAPVPTVVPLAADGPLMPTPEQLAAIANGFIDYDLVASTPDDTDDTPDEAP